MSQTKIRGLVADTGFWLAAFDRGETHHGLAAEMLENIRRGVILLPWPIIYETLRTQTVKNPSMVRAFRAILRQHKVLQIDDAKYREDCLASTIDQVEQVSGRRRSISLVDAVIRAMLCDEGFRVTQLLTFNPRDFADVCNRRRISLWPSRLLS